METLQQLYVSLLLFSCIQFCVLCEGILFGLHVLVFPHVVHLENFLQLNMSAFSLRRWDFMKTWLTVMSFNPEDVVSHVQ